MVSPARPAELHDECRRKKSTSISTHTPRGDLFVLAGHTAGSGGLPGAAIGQPGDRIDLGLFAKRGSSFQFPRADAQAGQKFAVDDGPGEKIVDAGLQGLV